MNFSSTPILDNPWTGESLPVPKVSTAGEALSALEAARLAQRRWARTGIDERIELCGKLSSLLSGGSRLAQSMVDELVRYGGKTRKQAGLELERSVETVDYLSSIALEMLVDLDLPSPEGELRQMSHEPVGVVIRVPHGSECLLSTLQVVIPAVLAGNSVVVVSPVRAASTLSLLDEAFAQVDAPEALVSTICLAPSDLHSLCVQPAVGQVSFSGNEAEGRALYSSVAEKSLVGVALELEGVNTAYVAADSRLDEAAAELVQGCFAHSGQNPWITRRVFVHHDRYEEFLKRASEEIGKLSFGSEEDPLMGPVAEAGAVVELEEELEKFINSGARVVVEGKARELDGGRFFSPLLLSVNAEASSSLVGEPIPGPVMVVSKVGDDDEAVSLMNASRFGQAASIWTRAPLRAERMGLQLDVGSVFMNRYPFPNPSLPWNPRGSSGRANLLSHWAFAPMTRRKSWSFVIKDRF